MRTLPHTTNRRRLVTQLLCGSLLAGGLVTGHAGEQRNWQLHEFTNIQLVAREAGSEPNQHPARIAPEALHEQLSRVQFVSAGKRITLFGKDELAELIEPLSQALERAAPADDVLLLSSARREGGLLGSPTAITARMFVQGGALQFIVRDARYAFYDTYRGTNVQPRFSYPSRKAASSTALESAGVANKRADWLQLSAAAAPTAAPAPVVAPAPTPAAAPAPAAARPADAEQRLETLKRLRERNLITEEEYQQKRREILQQL
ncbi:MAG TPA: SHOCT domain-containing protein [Rhizobacter sp.]|nr:SHOCT domain-containing protein [Rhizobacter sp.]